MPLYDYSGEMTIKFGKKVVLPGERFISEEYLNDSNLNLISDLPAVDAQVDSLFAGEITAGVVQEVEIDISYKRISMYNICGGICKIYTNDDSDKAIRMPNNTFYNLDNRERKIGTINISGEVTGKFYINVDNNII